MASTSFDPSNHTHYAEITSDNAQVANSNDNLLYDLSLLDSTFWNNQAVSGGGDIRITNAAGDTAYSFELENFNNNGDGTGTGIIFFNSQGLSTSSNTTYRIYVGDSSASLPAPSDTLGAENVWSSEYGSVFHLDESSGTTAKDSTGNRDASYLGDLPTQVSGTLGNAQDFDGSGDLVDQGASSSSTIYNATSATVSIWMNMDTIERARNWNIERDGEADSRIELTSDGTFNMIIVDDSGSYYWLGDGPSGGISTGNWVHIVLVWGGGNNMTIYKNGTDVTSEFTVNNSGGPTEVGGDSRSEAIGARANTPDLEVNGKQDEFRSLTTTLSSNYIQTEYNNQSDPASFWTTGATVATDTPGRIGERNSSGIGIRTSAGIGKTD